MAVNGNNTEAGIVLATKVVDKLDAGNLLIALLLILCILIVGLLIRQSLGKKSEQDKQLQIAKASNELAAAKSSKRMHEGQGEELKSLHERLNSIDSEVKLLQKESVQMQSRILHLESALNNVSLHFKNLDLCEGCQKTNRVTLFSIRNLLDAAT